MAARASFPAVHALRARTRVRTEGATSSRAVRRGIVSVAGLVGTPVVNQTGQDVGRVVDIVARLYGEERYPPVTGLVIRVGRRRAFVDATAVAAVERRRVVLRTSRFDLRDYLRRPGEVLLARDVMDHQLVDVDGVQVIRAADLYLAPLAGNTVLVGVDVSLQTLLRRLGPKRLRWVPTPDRVLDWDAVAPFGRESTEGPATVQLRRGQEALHHLRPGELADLLEDLGRPARQELLAALPPGAAADALEEMDPEELEGLLRESAPDQAAALVAAMESDEAVDALRDLSGPEREELLDRIPAATRERLVRLLGYPEDRAGGFMTTRLLQAVEQDTVAQVRARLAAWREHHNELDAVVVCDDGNRVVADVPLFDLLVTEPERTVAELLGTAANSDPVVVGPDADVGEVAAALVESRRSSLLVVDPDGRPLGRILADDVVDALTPETGRRHFPRLLR